MTPTLADLVMALNRERARTARLRTLLTRRNRTIDDLLDTLDQTQQELRAARGATAIRATAPEGVMTHRVTLHPCPRRCIARKLGA